MTLAGFLLLGECNPAEFGIGSLVITHVILPSSL